MNSIIFLYVVFLSYFLSDNAFISLHTGFVVIICIIWLWGFGTREIKYLDSLEEKIESKELSSAATPANKIEYVPFDKDLADIGLIAPVLEYEVDWTLPENLPIAWKQSKQSWGELNKHSTQYLISSPQARFFRATKPVIKWVKTNA